MARRNRTQAWGHGGEAGRKGHGPRGGRRASPVSQAAATPAAATGLDGGPSPKILAMGRRVVRKKGDVVCGKTQGVGRTGAAAREKGKPERRWHWGGVVVSE